ncbi:Uu.00g029810.m01.CDS01 [Anthostomella pinea]|uniref:Uu.00g029810.m01.CDS01 n=1 Tax=Anthostomella pinea TaxID=933095 RepID=A0AAI8V886_9PEZI|nr:Uu.00g029810.m01.CDS01 [Anthostomella pinea]
MATNLTYGSHLTGRQTRRLGPISKLTRQQLCSLIRCIHESPGQGWIQWRASLREALEVYGLLVHIEYADASNGRPESERQEVASFLWHSLSDEVQRMMRGIGCNITTHHSRPSRMYTSLLELGEASGLKSRFLWNIEATSGGPTRESDVAEAEIGEGWTTVSLPAVHVAASRGPMDEAPEETMQDRIVRITADLESLTSYYNITSSSTRHNRLDEFYTEELSSLRQQPFHSYDQDEKVDYILLKTYLRRAQRTLKLDQARDAASAPFIEPFAAPIKAWLEGRQSVDAPLDPKAVADNFATTEKVVFECQEHVRRTR